MSAKLPFDASEGQVQVTQLEHVSVEDVLYPPQLYYSYDFDLADEDSVLSIADGVIVSLVNNVPEGTSLAPINHGSDAVTYPQLGPGGLGNQVTIYYDTLGLYVTYAHLKTDSIPFSQSDIDAGTATVSQGEEIGVVGLTGTGTGPHLHITYGTTLTGWGGSTSSVYPTTTIANGSIAANPNDFELLFDEAGGQPLSLSSYTSQNSELDPIQSDPSVSMSFAGTVTSVTSTGISVPGDVQIGDVVVGSFSYIPEEAITEQQFDPTWNPGSYGVYSFPQGGSSQGITYTINGQTWSTGTDSVVSLRENEQFSGFPNLRDIFFIGRANGGDTADEFPEFPGLISQSGDHGVTFSIIEENTWFPDPNSATTPDLISSNLLPTSNGDLEIENIEGSIGVFGEIFTANNQLNFSDQEYRISFEIDPSTLVLSAGDDNSPPQVTGDTNQNFTGVAAIPLADLFDLSDPDGLDDIVEVRISDDTAGFDGGELGQFVFTFQGFTAGNFWVPQQRIEGEPYRLTLTPDQLDDQTGGPFPVPVWNYRPSNEGSNAIQIEAVDSAGNVSDPLIINLTFTRSTSGTEVLSEDFDRSNGEAVGNGWVEIQETSATDPAYTGSATLNIEDGRLAFRYDAEGVTPARDATFQQPFMARDIGTDVGQTGFELSFSFQAGDGERVRHMVGVMDGDAGTLIATQGGGDVMIPVAGIGIELTRSGSDFPTSGFNIFRFDGDSDFAYESAIPERVGQGTASFSYEQDQDIEVSFAVEKTGEWTVEISNGTITDTFNGTMDPLTETLDQVTMSSIEASGGFFGDQIEVVTFDDLRVSTLDDAPIGLAPIVSGQTSIPLDVAGSGGTTSVTFDSSVLNVTDTDGDLSFIRFYDSTPGDDGGFLALDGVRITGTFVDVGPAGLERISYIAGPNDGTNDIVVEAFDLEGNDSNDFTVRLNVTGEITQPNEAPSATASSITVAPGISTPLSSLFSWSDPDGIADVLEFSVVDQSVGGGYLSLDGSPVVEPEGTTIMNIPLSDIGRWAFVSGADGDSDNIGFAVTDSSGNTSDATVAIVESNDVPVALQQANTLELEYFAREAAYGRGPLGEIGAMPATDALSTFENLNGWEIEYVFGTSGGTFRAIALKKPGFDPVLAFRGTELTTFDWAQNFTEPGVGADEFNNSLSTTGIAGPAAVFGPAPNLAQYLASRDGLVLTGHSQGGAQAQLAAIEAGNSGADVGRVVTFNAAGITSPETTDVLPSADRVTHFVNASDIVSVVGETFLESNDLRYYDHTDSSGVDAFSIYTAHSAQWMQSELRSYFPSETFPDSVLIENGPDWNELSSGNYSPISFIYGQDREYLEMMIDFISIGYVIDDLEDFKPLITGGIGGAPQTVVNLIRDEANIRAFIDDTFIPALSTRDGLESVRGGEIGALFGKTLNAIGTIAQLIQDGVSFIVDGVFNVIERVETLKERVVDAFTDAAVTTVEQTIEGLKLIAGTVHGIGDAIKDGIAAGSEAVKDWIVDRVSGPAPVVVQDGAHAESSPAVVINTTDETSGSLTSLAPSSLFLLTNPSTEVVQTGGGNVVWGLASDFDGTNVVGGVSTTDAMFLQNEFFNTEDMDRDPGSAIIRVDLDQDGETDITITWEGNYRLESIVAEQGTDGTYIRYLGNGLPEATDDAFETSEATSFTTGNVLENDTDEDGDDLNVTGIDTASTLGLVTDNGDGTFDYDPNGAFDGLAEGETATDTFVYFVSDGVETVQGEVTIAINGEDDVVEPVLNPVTGTSGRDNLVGTDGADAIRSLAGSYDRMFGDDGADLFIFGEESSNGVRERDVIMDYEVGIDSIVLEAGTSVASIRETSTQVVVFLDGDRDAIYVRGDGVTADNLTIITDDMFQFV